MDARSSQQTKKTKWNHYRPMCHFKLLPSRVLLSITRFVHKTLSNICDETFCGNSWSLIGVNYFYEKSSSQIFHWILITPLSKGQWNSWEHWLTWNRERTREYWQYVVLVEANSIGKYWRYTNADLKISLYPDIIFHS